MALVGVEDFGAGIYRGREAPPNAAYDLVNLLLDDEGQPFRRGGSAFKSNANAGGTLQSLVDAYTIGGQRTVFWRSGQLHVLAADDATPVNIPTSPGAPPTFGRPALMRGILYWPSPNPPAATYVMAYAGSRKTAAYTTGTAATTAGSKTVTGAGTAWLANVDPGMFISIFTGIEGVVESVQSDTSLTLIEPASMSTGATIYSATPVKAIPGLLNPLGTTQAPYVTATRDRLLIAWDRRVLFSDGFLNGLPVLNPANTVNFHEMPGSSLMVGIQGFGGSALAFSTAGAWNISNLLFDPIDDVGNIQHTVTQASEVILWGEMGIAGWSGAVVVPAIDDVYLMTEDGQARPIGGGIKPLYLSYVKAGYQPGQAAVHRGHYVLPVLNGATLVDVLVGRLDRSYRLPNGDTGVPWTRLAGHAAGVAYAQRIGASTRSPKLFSVAAQRVTEVTDAWAPSASNASDADGTTHAIDLVTRDLPTPGGAKGSTTRKLRVRYEAAAAGAISVTASYARGLEGAAFTALGAAIRGGVGSDGLDESVWAVGKQSAAIRFRLQSSSALSSLKLRGLAAEYTERGA